MQLYLSGRRSALLLPTLAVTIAFIAPLAATAQTDSIAADGTGVARISLISGTVGVQRGDSSESLAAALNAPVLGGDYITTGDGSRTEIQFDGSSQLRLGSSGQLRFTRLDSGNRALQLAQGTAELRLLQTAGTNEIDTPSISIKPQTRGAYRVTVTTDGQSLVTVRRGEAEVDTPQGAQTLLPGSTLIAQGAAGNPTVQTVAAIAPDDFDSFNAERDRLHERGLADSAFVNSDIGGIDDLNGNGRWVTDGSYGHVWVPAEVGPDWAPYRNGRWVWEDGYGWTWVAAEPWGWAPYHYGSWYHSPDYGWCWYPPRPQIEAPWRPALVAFFGFGTGAGFSLGFGGGPSFGNIGWVPLAPFEAYHPWWGNRYGAGGNTTIINNVTNVNNVTNINVYRNVQYNGVSGVTSQRFLQGNFGRNERVATTELRRAQIFRSALPIVPTASNLRFTNDPQKAAVATRAPLVERSFAGAAPAVRRTSFADQRVALANVTHAPITPLHFKDASATPLLPQPRSIPQAPVAARPDVRPLAPVHPSYAKPIGGAAASDPWARFNQSRAIDPQRRITPVAPAAENTYRQPAAGKTFEETTTGNADNQPGHKLQRDTPPAAGHPYAPPADVHTSAPPAGVHPYAPPAASHTSTQPANAHPSEPVRANIAPRVDRQRSYDNAVVSPRALQTYHEPRTAGGPPAEAHPPAERVNSEKVRATPDVKTERPPRTEHR